MFRSKIISGLVSLLFFVSSSVVTTVSASTVVTTATTAALNQAIAQANAATGSYVIDFGFTAPTTITLTSTPTQVTLLADNLTVQNTSGYAVTLDGNSSYSILVNPYTNVTLDTLGLTQCSRSNGGAIYCGFGSNITIDNSTLSNNFASSGGGGGGGAIWTGNPLTISNSTISGNSTNGDGGAIFNFASTTISGSDFSGNTAANLGGVFY
jgi:hypothetical protein